MVGINLWIGKGGVDNFVVQVTQSREGKAAKPAISSCRFATGTTSCPGHPMLLSINISA